jgi:hypothetical protein
MSASLKMTCELVEELSAEWKISAGEMWTGVHLSTGKEIEAKTQSALVQMLKSWTRDLYMAVC